MWARLMESFVDNGGALESVQNWNLGWIRHRWLLYLFFSGRSVQFSLSVMSDSLQPHGLQHTRLPCPSLTPGDCSNSCPSSQWCHPTISSSVVPFSCLQSFPASGTLFQWVSSLHHVAKVLEFQLQHQSFQLISGSLGLTGWISLQTKGLSRVFSNTTVQSISSLVLSFLYSPTLTSIDEYWKNHRFDYELQNYNSLLNNNWQENVGSHQKRYPNVQRQMRSPSKTVGGV